MESLEKLLKDLKLEQHQKQKEIEKEIQMKYESLKKLLEDVESEATK